MNEISELIELLQNNYQDIARLDGTMLDIDSYSNKYCVGGALCAYADGINAELLCQRDISLRFPDEHSIAASLRKINKVLNYDKAGYYARNIVWDNDNGRFDKAWQIVKKALNYSKGDDDKDKR